MRTRVHLNEGSDYEDTPGAHSDFDYDELARRLGEQHEIEPSDYAKLATAIRALNEWLLQGDLSTPKATERIGRKLIALCWVVNPGMFNGISLTQLSRQLGTHVPIMSQFTAEVRRRFGICNSSQAHGWNFKSEAPQ